MPLSRCIWYLLVGSSGAKTLMDGGCRETVRDGALLERTLCVFIAAYGLKAVNPLSQEWTGGACSPQLLQGHHVVLVPLTEG